MNSGIEPSVTKKVRKYFKDTKNHIGLIIVLILLGFPILKVSLPIGLILLAIAGFLIYRVATGGFRGEETVDQMRDMQIRILQQRGLNKLKLVNEQIELVKPIVLTGIGANPDSSFGETAKVADLFKIFHVFKNLKEAIKSLFGKNKDLDPMEAYKIGSDEALRSLLVEVSVYFCTENQVLLYVGDVDISTGLIYNEYTSEAFYQDVEAMNFEQSLYKVYNPKKKKSVNKMKERVVLYLGGCKFSSSVNTELDASIIDREFAAMRNLIRDKKTS